MRNVWRLFTGDLKRLFSNVITVIIVLGLVALPSIFSWYNILACWDVFNNTGSLKVAVANSDAGYKSDLVPLKINIGDQVVSALEANDQLDWVITDEDDAVDGTRAGRYYAAVVIPESFSGDMLSFYADDSEQGTLVYYSNQKKNAIASKIVTQGADAVSRQVNEAFTEAISEVLLGTLSTIADYVDSSEFSTVVTKIAGHVGDAGAGMRESAKTVRQYAKLLDSSKALVRSSEELLADLGDAVDEADGAMSGAEKSASSIEAELAEATTGLSSALSSAASGYGGLADAIESAFDDADGLATGSASKLSSSAGTVDGQASQVRELARTLESFEESLLPGPRARLAAVVQRLDDVAAALESLSEALDSAATDLNDGVAVGKQQREQAVELANEAKGELESARDLYRSDVQPALDELSDAVSQGVTALSGAAAVLGDASDEVSEGTESVYGGIDRAQAKLETAASELEQTGGELVAFEKRVKAALSAGDNAELMRVLEGDAATRAQLVAAPVSVERTALYPVENFGSAMAPLYTTLAIWIGALLIMVALKPVPSSRIRAGLDRPRNWELFVGRYGVVAVLSLMQTTAIALGNLLFLHVQVEHPFYYLLVFWICGLVFSFIIYTLVVSFANLGKALSVVLLIVQVAGGGASFPLQLLPQFFQDISPYLPITHAADAMRAAMFGIYNGDLWAELAWLVLFALPFLVLGIALRRPLSAIVRKFVSSVESSKLM